MTPGTDRPRFTRSICRLTPHVADRPHTTYHHPSGSEPTTRLRAPRAAGWPLRSGTTRLDPEVLGAHLGPLLRTASTLCDSRESAEDLVQDTVARVLSRPRLLRGGDERAYLMQALRNTFLTSRRTAARRPRLVTTLEELDAADRRTGTRPEEAVIARQVFPAIAQLPESFRLALVAVDIAGLSYGEAAQVLGAPEATITTRLYRARQRVAASSTPNVRRYAIEAQPRAPRPSSRRRQSRDQRHAHARSGDRNEHLAHHRSPSSGMGHGDERKQRASIGTSQSRISGYVVRERLNISLS